MKDKIVICSVCNEHLKVRVNLYNKKLKLELLYFIQYQANVNKGLGELDVQKLSTVLTAKYGSINAAQRELGAVGDIRQTFVDFQQHLYAA